jgi:hypothetical protein
LHPFSYLEVRKQQENGPIVTGGAGAGRSGRVVFRPWTHPAALVAPNAGGRALSAVRVIETVIGRAPACVQ